MDQAFLEERITVTKALIVAYEDAATALATGGVQSYRLDTGQSTTSVTKLDLEWINSTLDGLYNRLATMQARLNGSGVHTARPAW